MEELNGFLLEHATGDLLSWADQNAAAERFGVPLARIEETALSAGLLPARYQRNRQAISVTQQLTLFRSRVAVIGCGGLGGYAIEQLARLGVGTIIAIDPDVFEEHNLNRQLLSTTGTLGRAKVEAAAARVTEINPAVTLIPVRDCYSPENGTELLRDAQVVVDALDSIPTRLALAETCAELGIPLVHGAIGGWLGGRKRSGAAAGKPVLHPGRDCQHRNGRSVQDTPRGRRNLTQPETLHKSSGYAI